MNVSCFKAYDIRGRVPEELNEETAWRIGRAFIAETGWLRRHTHQRRLRFIRYPGLCRPDGFCSC